MTLKEKSINRCDTPTTRPAQGVPEIEHISSSENGHTKVEDDVVPPNGRVRTNAHNDTRNEDSSSFEGGQTEDEK